MITVIIYFSIPSRRQLPHLVLIEQHREGSHLALRLVPACLGVVDDLLQVSSVVQLLHVRRHLEVVRCHEAVPTIDQRVLVDQDRLEHPALTDLLPQAQVLGHRQARCLLSLRMNLVPELLERCVQLVGQLLGIGASVGLFGYRASQANPLGPRDPA